jgi:hypothetical protein
MRMDPDRGVEPVEPVDAREGALGGWDVPARNQDPLQAGQPSRPDDLVGVGVETIRVEMAVGIDETGQLAAAAYRPISLPSGSRTAANRPWPGISDGGVTTDPPFAVAAATAASRSSTSM